VGVIELGCGFKLEDLVVGIQSVVDGVPFQRGAI
jgi:hypothetical protein